MNTLLRYIGLFIGTVLLGWIGGICCGFIILSFGDLIGQSGTTGTEYVGYWAPQHALFAATIYGSPIGMLMCPIGYFLFLRHIPFFKALSVTALGTIVGGCIGALIGPPLAVFIGIAGFFCACVCLGVAEFDSRKAD